MLCHTSKSLERKLLSLVSFLSWHLVRCISFLQKKSWQTATHRLQPFSEDTPQKQQNVPVCRTKRLTSQRWPASCDPHSRLSMCPQVQLGFGQEGFSVEACCVVLHPAPQMSSGFLEVVPTDERFQFRPSSISLISPVPGVNCKTMNPSLILKN